MTETAVDHYITDLTEDLRPVGRLRSPWIRALGWLAPVAATGAVLAWFSDLGDVAYRLRFVPDMWMAVLGSALTTGLGAIATFQLSLPDRSERWALLPLPGLALWVAASGMGCFRVWVIPDMHAADRHHRHRGPCGRHRGRDRGQSDDRRAAADTEGRRPAPHLTDGVDRASEPIRMPCRRALSGGAARPASAASALGACRRSAGGLTSWSDASRTSDRP